MSTDSDISPELQECPVCGVVGLPERIAAHDCLGAHGRLLLSILANADGRLAADEFHRRYDARADAFYYGRLEVPLSRRARRERLAKLSERNVVIIEGAGSTRCYRLAESVDAGE